jgi:hypothetical protein
MAAGPLLRSEPLQRYRALGTAGDPVWRAAGQLRAAISHRLSREHADLLGVPEVDPTGQRIDWYAPFEGEAQRLTDLPEPERAAILDKVRRLHDDIAQLAESMTAPARSGAERNFGRLLRHALTAPGEEALYIVDGRPVMTFWGFSTDAALPGAFLAMPPAAPQPAAVQHAVLASAPAAAATLAPQARSTWWQWLLLAALLLLLLAALAWLIRPYLPHLEPRLAAAARDQALGFATQQPVEFQQTRITNLLQDNEALRLELARLSDEVARRGSDCSAGVIVPGGVVVGGVAGGPIERGAVPDATAGVGVATGTDDVRKPPDKGLEKGIERGVGAGPDAKDPKDVTRNVDRNVTKNVDKNVTKGPNEHDRGALADKDKMGRPKDEPKPMVVPPEAKQRQDLAFLQGDWRSRTGLATAQGERDIRPSYTLDKSGKGRVTFVQSNGATCEAPTEARWDNGKLVIEEKSNPKCSDGRTYARNTINCEIGADGAAQCKGSQPGDQRSYNVQIGR